MYELTACSTPTVSPKSPSLIVRSYITPTLSPLILGATVVSAPAVHERKRTAVTCGSAISALS